MNWLTNWMMREGPGIPKNAPKKKGLALFLSIVLREAWDLFRLNLLMLLFSIPVITAPAAFAAGLRVTTLMVEDENVWLWRDFQRAFRHHFVAATLWGLGFALVAGLGIYAVFIYGQMAKQSLLFALPVGIAICVLAVAAMTAICLFQLMVRAALRPGALLRASLLAMLSRPLSLLGGLAFVIALWLLHVAFYPVTVFMPVVFNFSLGALAMAFAAFKATGFALTRVGRMSGTQGAKPHLTAQSRI